MAEVIVATEGQGNYCVAEHTVRRVMAGDTEAVRARLVYALERLGYQVVSENPLHARRAARKDVVRSDFLDHARKLSISLRPSSASATVATFDFVVVHGGCMFAGDKKTLGREADAVVALAAAPPAASVCRNCGTENAGDARFCRLCGAPGAAGEPAELEVMRLTAGSRAALQEISIGLLVAVAILIPTIPMILLGKTAKIVNVSWGFLVLGQLCAWWMVLYGLLRLHRTLNSGRAPAAETFAPHAVHASETSALLPAPARASVTEGTTELLTPAAARREPVPLRRVRPDTNPFESGRR